MCIGYAVGKTEQLLIPTFDSDLAPLPNSNYRPDAGPGEPLCDILALRFA